jgi:uncharacterized RDD family membrane protein YckC
MSEHFQPSVGAGPVYPAGPPVYPPGPAQAPPGLYLDQISGLYLPAGTELAGAGRRIAAWFLAIPLSIVTLGVGYLIWGVIVWGRGQTPTYQVLHMRCWRPETGRVAGWWWMALREVIGRLVDEVLGPITLVISFILMLATRERRCLHDMVAGTLVVFERSNPLV